MTPAVLVGLMVLAGFLHATWNLLAKASPEHRIALLVSISAVMAVLCLPWAVLHPPEALWPIVPLVAVRASLQGVYTVSLGVAYGHADFSLVYPLARGTGPLVATGLAVAILGERPALIGVAGIVLISVGIASIAVLTPGRPVRRARMLGTVLALVTGAVIGTYTVVDKAAVSYSDPITYLCLSEALVFILFVVVSLARGRSTDLTALLPHWRRVLIAGVLATAAYGFALYAMTHAYASYIAPLREISVLFAVVLAGLVLKEPGAARRIPSAVAIVAGMTLVGFAL